MPYEMILYEKSGPVVTITLNWPQTLNAINAQMTAELHGALDEAEADAGIRAIILTGAGRAFSAGYGIARRPDGKSSLDPTGMEVGDFLRRWWTNDSDATQRLLHLWHLSKPVIAAVHGSAAARTGRPQSRVVGQFESSAGRGCAAAQSRSPMISSTDQT